MRKMHSFRRLHSQGETRPAVPAPYDLKRGARCARRGPRGMFHVEQCPVPGAMAPGKSIERINWPRRVVAVL
jgi:hypothetical protein